jgi:hypothetical protein
MFMKCALLNQEIKIQFWARECWSIGVLGFSITPSLQYSNTPMSNMKIKQLLLLRR